MTDFDLVVIGGGAAGLGAARAAAARSARVALVTDGPVGGDCTFTGCIPSKTLIESAASGMAYPDAIQRLHEAIALIASTEDADALAAENMVVITGRARLEGPGRILIDGRPVTADKVIIASGAEPSVPSIPGLTSLNHHTTNTIFDLEQLPGSLIVLGGGAIGCELAQAFATFGSQVTIVEASERILPTEDPEVSAIIASRFHALGITVVCEAHVRSVQEVGEQVRLEIAGGSGMAADRLLVATGRRPNTEGLGLDTVAIRIDARGAIPVDERMATSAEGVYAAGDVTGLYPFTHAADAMARVAAGNALSRHPRARFSTSAIPRVIFTDPEVAQVGQTEAEAVERGGLVAYLPMSDVDRAITAGRTEGFIKLITAPAPLTRNIGGGRVIGATIVAPRAGEMIGELALAMKTRMFAGRLAQTTHAYPTWSHAIQLVAAQFFGHGRRPYRAGETRPV